jgi:hypothetical protein
MSNFRTMYGWAELGPPARVIAGSTGSFTLTYHVGRYGIDDGGTVKIAVRFASDWGYPQVEDPRAPNYVTVRASGSAKISYRFDLKGYIRPYQKCLVIDVADWSLAEGDTITVVYGDSSGGSPGTVMQTFREYSFEFKVAVDPFGTGEFVELEEPPTVEIVPAPAAKLVVIAPTQVVAGEEFAAGIKLEDEWGNPAVDYAGTVGLEEVEGLEGMPDSYRFTEGDQGVHRFTGLRCGKPGLFRLKGRDGEGLEEESNPIVCTKQEEVFQPFWGDLHGQSEETVGTNSVDDYFQFARDVAMVDFVGHQGNDFQVTPQFWDEINRCTREFDEPGRFVTFPGYEWSAMTPAGGDHNVYYMREGEEIFRTSHWQVAEERESYRRDLANDRYPITELYEELRGKEAMVVPHIGGRPANLAFHDPNLEPVIEIYSAWGQFEWLLREAIERGYKVGFAAGSDDHKGRPGASYPGSSSFGVYGGMTCVLARELTREGIWEGIKARRCYATSGQRIALEVRSGDRWMGEEFRAEGKPSFAVSAAGTADIEEVRVVRGLETIYTYPEAMPRDRKRIRVKWSGALIKGRARIAPWDGELRLEGGRILMAEPFAFDSAAEEITSWDENRVAWKSVTSGDEDGLILGVEGDGETRIHFNSGIASFEVSLAELEQGVHRVPAGGVDLQVEVEYLPLGLQDRACRFEFTDENPLPGCQPYYVRLTQTDGARAWSSPFYIQNGE